MTDTITNLAGLVGELIALKARISDLNRTLKDLKEEEESLKRSILLSMGTAKSMTLDGLGRVTRKERSHYEIRDNEAFAYAMFERMLENGKKGLPLGEGLMLQQRASGRAIDEIMDSLGLDAAGQEEYLARAGLAKVSETTLSITRS